MLTLIDGLLPRDLVRRFRKTLRSARWLDGSETAGTQARGVKSNQQLGDRSEPAAGLRRQLLACLGRHQRFLSAALPHKILPPTFSRYAAGHRYGPHMDNPIMPLDGMDQLLRTDLSATVFLSEPDEYDGGELTIETAYGPHAVKQNAGDLILYPSGSLHHVTPVTRGTRLCALLRIQSMVRDTQRRTLLFDLDRSVQALTRERGTTDAEVQRLTGGCTIPSSACGPTYDSCVANAPTRVLRLDIRIRVGVAESAPPRRGVERVRFGPTHVCDRRDDELRDPFAARDRHGLGAQVDDQHFDFVAIVGVNGAGRVEQAEAAAQGEPAARTELGFVSVGDRQREAGRNQRAAQGFEHHVAVEVGGDVHAGRAGRHVARQGKRGVAPAQPRDRDDDFSVHLLRVREPPSKCSIRAAVRRGREAGAESARPRGRGRNRGIKRSRGSPPAGLRGG